MLLNNNSEISPAVFKQLRDLVYKKSGMFFPDNKAYLFECRIEQRVKDSGCKSFDDYLSLLVYESDGKEIALLLNLITINETSFFRDIEQLEVVMDGLLHSIVAEKIKKGGTKKLRIWSAASSSGEEPYTLAILLLEKHSLLLSGWDVEILGSDISEAVLSAARKGMYNNYAIKSTPENYLKKYFLSTDGNAHSVKPEVKQKVTFANINLYDKQETNNIKEMDIILCRNVLIYFDENSKRKVISGLHESLNIGGYLAIGRSESFPTSAGGGLKLTIIDKMAFYKKTLAE